MSHFTFNNLTKNYDFFSIDENEISFYEDKNKEYHCFLSWQTRSDGHGGTKGGTFEEYQLQLGCAVNIYSIGGL